MPGPTRDGDSRGGDDAGAPTNIPTSERLTESTDLGTLLRALIPEAETATLERPLPEAPLRPVATVPAEKSREPEQVAAAPTVPVRSGPRRLLVTLAVLGAFAVGALAVLNERSEGKGADLSDLPLQPVRPAIEPAVPLVQPSIPDAAFLGADAPVPGQPRASLAPRSTEVTATPPLAAVPVRRRDDGGSPTTVEVPTRPPAVAPPGIETRAEVDPTPDANAGADPAPALASDAAVAATPAALLGRSTEALLAEEATGRVSGSDESASGGTRPPTVSVRVEPSFPASAVATGARGVIVLAVRVDAAGRPTSVKAIGGPPSLRDAAEDAVRRWRFQPATRGGVAIPGDVRVELPYGLPIRKIRERNQGERQQSSFESRRSAERTAGGIE